MTASAMPPGVAASFRSVSRGRFPAPPGGNAVCECVRAAIRAVLRSAQRIPPLLPAPQGVKAVTA